MSDDALESTQDLPGKELSTFEKYLPLWIGICMIMGILLSQVITGIGESMRGTVHIVYTDETDAVGAWFKIKNYVDWICDDNFPNDINYEEYGFFFDNTVPSGHEIISNDFPAKGNYNITLHVIDDMPRCFRLWELNNTSN